MGTGTILIGAALAAVVAAYLAHPFRKTGDSIDTDRSIEMWVGQVQVRREEPVSTKPTPPSTETAEEINFCPQCGRKVGPDDHFCAGCGKQIR